nr:baseplate J/gp47 family protein [Aurantiacibacter suaedae]
MAIASDSFTGVDLSRLPAPSVIEQLDYAAIRADALAQFATYFPDFDPTLESDPLIKVIELFAYRELLLRQRVNDAARAVMPAFALGADLDALAALLGVERFIIDPGNPALGIAPTYESDDSLRRRMVLAPEGYSVAGPEGAYIFHALSANSDVLDASAISPTPGEVVVTVLSRKGDGTASAPVLAAVEARLTDSSVRPLTDHVTVQSAQIVPFTIAASITFLSGPDRSVVLAEAGARLADHLANALRLGRDVTRAGIIAALHPEGVQNITLAQPPADLVLTRQQCGYCEGVTLTDAGVGE